MSRNTDPKPTTYAEWEDLEEERDQLRAHRARLAAELLTAREEIDRVRHANRVLDAVAFEALTWRYEVERLSAELARVREERDDMANAVRFLAKQEARTFEIRATAIRMLAKGEVEEAKHLVIMKWPIVQGFRNQINLATVGNQPCDLKRVRPAIEVLLRAALAQPQDGTTEPTP